jgi:hypothetical protein
MIGFKIEIMNRLLIGVDPGSNCGLATLEPQTGQLLLYQFNSNIEAMFFVMDLIEKYDVEMFIEDARLFKKSAFHAKTSNPGRQQGVGSVKGASKEWEAFTRLLKIKCQMMPIGQTKTSPEYFFKLTGIQTLKTQHHKRDAAMIILGRK